MLIRDAKPAYYVYRLTWNGRVQTGLAAVASLADYATNRVRKHELTTPVKEDDRVRQIEAVNAQTGPVMMGYPPAPAIDAMLAKASAGAPDVDVTADDGVRHQMWVVADEATIAALTRAFDALPAIYIADGHHRSAAAARVAQARNGARLAQRFPVGDLSASPDDDPRLQPRHPRPQRPQRRIRCSRELKRALHGRRRPISRCGPASAGEFGMYLAGRWYRLTTQARAHSRERSDRPAADHAARAQRASSRCSASPIQRTDKRIDFVGGGRGLGELEKRVSSGEMAVAFALYPTQMDDLMAVADAGKIMPPKSTWFEPKLADGMVNHVLD